MNASKFHSWAKNILSGVLIATLVLTIISCSKKMVFFNSKVVPAAQGTVSVRKDKNQNYLIKVQINDLAEVSRLQGNKLTYVVWMIKDQEKTENIGQLKSEKTILFKKLKATLTTVSSSYPIKIFITAENDGGVQTPGSQVILSTDRY
jgi:hypothetical protein